MKGVKRFINLADIHYPKTIGLRSVFNFIEDFMPDYLILSGDIWELDMVSNWGKANFANEGYKNISEKFNTEARQVRELLQDLSVRVTPMCKRIFIYGNHEDRLARFCIEHPQLTLNMRIHEILQLKDSGWGVVPLGGFYKLGKLYFMHGEKYRSEMFTKKAAMDAHRSIRIGHHHTEQSYVAKSPLDSDDIICCKGVPCLCDLNPEWYPSSTNSWCNGFNYGYILPNGNFTDYIVQIHDGKFVAEGKLYA
jgi:hypothetical protein